jgi:DNA-binding LacI/PurR family transcriptional regulator
MATLSDIAARVGVSVSMVSRVLRDAPGTRVGEHTRARIRQAAADLDYRPHFAGRALRSQRSQVLALVVPDLTNAVFAELMAGVEETASAHDHVVLLGRAESMGVGSARLGALVAEGRVDGILLQPQGAVTAEELAGAHGAPLVLINSLAEGHVGSVRLPDEQAGRCGARALLDLGHRHIAFVGGRRSDYSSARRERGWRAQLAQAGVEHAPALHPGYTAEDGRSALRELAGLTPRPTAVLVANVNAAIGLLGEAHRAGVRVPEDLSVVAVHDAWTAQSTWPPLTTVAMPLRELGSQATQLLLDRLDGAPPRDELVDAPVRLVVRESTRAFTGNA